MARIIRKEEWDKRLDLATLSLTPCETWIGIPSRGVISPEAIESIDLAREILASAEGEADRVKGEATVILERARIEFENKKEEGFKVGLEEGKAEFTENIVSVRKEREEMIKNAEHELVDLVGEIVQKVLAKEVDKGAIVDVVRNSLSKLQGREVVLRVNPEDVKHLREKQSELAELLGESRVLSVREDETVEQGGCIIETELGTLDAKLSTQLERIKKALGLN